MNLETCLSVRPYFVLGQQAIVAAATIRSRRRSDKAFRAGGSTESSQAPVSVRVEEASDPVLGVVHSGAVRQIEDSSTRVSP
jgi:hypothetical protein